LAGRLQNVSQVTIIVFSCRISKKHTKFLTIYK
jgi:hypothetical protein